MATNQSSNKKLLWIDGHALDPTTIESKDVDAVMSSKGLLPLTEDERMHLSMLTYTLDRSTAALKLLMGALLDADNVSKEDIKAIEDDVSTIINASNEVLEIDVELFGRGLVWEKS